MTHFRIAWLAFKLHWLVLIVSTLLLFGSWVALEVTVISLQRLGVGLNIVLHAVFLLVFSGLMVGIHHISIQIIDGASPTLRSLTGLFVRAPSYLLAICLYFMAVVAGLIILVLPGIFLAVRYGLFGQVLGSRRVSALEALHEAASLSTGRWWNLFRFFLMVVVLNIAGAAILGVGLLITFPVTLLATTSLFRSLHPATPPSIGNHPRKTTYFSE